MKLFLDGTKLKYHPEAVAAWKADENISPLHVEVSLTDKCNLHCSFCYAAHRGRKDDCLSLDAFAGLCFDMHDMGVASCLLAGDGEPLLHPEIEQIAEIIAAVPAIDWALNTNGVKCWPSFLKTLLPHLSWLRFSVMGVSPENWSRWHGAPAHLAHQVMANIVAAVELKKQLGCDTAIGIQQVAAPGLTGEEIYAVAKFAVAAQVDYYVLKPWSNDARNETDDTIAYLPNDLSLVETRQLGALPGNTEILIRDNAFAECGQRDYDTCLGLPFISQIGADGGVYACCPHFGEKAFEYGNLNDNSFKAIWFGEQRRRVQAWVQETVDPHQCMSYCRHHQVNRYLWDLLNPPEHVNFI